MVIQAINNKIIKKVKTYNILTVVLFLAGCFCVAALPLFGMDGNKVTSEGLFLLAIFGGVFLISGSLVPWSWGLVYNRYVKLVGKKLNYSIDKNGITIEDSINSERINKAFSWQDIQYIQLQRYIINRNKNKFLYGLLFVADEDILFSSLEQKISSKNYEQRNTQLDGGFFIECPLNTIKNIANLSGKSIR